MSTTFTDYGGPRGTRFQPNPAGDERSSTNFILRDLVREAMSMDLDGAWTDALLFTPYEKDQVLMYEQAECVATRAFLKMANLPFGIEQRPNAEFISPAGKVPLLKLQKNLIAQFSPIVEFVGKKGVRLSETLTDAEKADLQAHVCLIEETLTNAEIYFTWQDSETYSKVTKQRYASVFKWPLYLWMPAIKHWQMTEYLQKINWRYLTTEQVLKKCERCFQALSVKLGPKNAYFFGDQPTELDALTFGHIFTIITTQMLDMRMAQLVKKYTNLIDFCKRINNELFSLNIVSKHQ